MRQFVSLTVMVATALSMPTYEDGAYTGLVVRVGEEVPVADCTKLLVELQVDRKQRILGKHDCEEQRMQGAGLKVVLDKRQAGL